jgi:hypothetical protein
MKEHYFKNKQQGTVTFMPQFIFLTPLYNSCMKGFVFPIFPLLDYATLNSFNQPSTLQTCPTVPPSPNDQETLLWTASH